MSEIVASVREVTELVAQIASASQEQSAGIEQVNTAVARMEQALQQNAALVDEATSATEAMKGEAGALLRTVGRFRLAAQDTAPAAVQLLHSLAVSGTSKYAGAAGRQGA
jgi:methyl-accepting chemotaxis protein